MQRSSKLRRDGMTLMELVVVITVLTILGGLVVAVLPNIMRRAHLGKCSDTIASLNNAWLREYNLKQRYPDVYDSLLASPGGTIFSPLTPGLAAQISPMSLDQTDLTALKAIGITRVVDLIMVPPGGNVTNDCASKGAIPRVLASGGQVAQLNLAAHIAAGNALNLKRHIGRNPDGSPFDNSANVRYLIFGIGPNCTGVGPGRAIQEAPTHFAADDSINPAAVYQRYLVVFSLERQPTTGVVTAYFEAAAGNDVGGPSSADDHIQQFYDAQRKGE